MGNTTMYSNLNQPTEALRGWMREAIERDDRRHSMPYEHTATLAGGIGLILSALIVPGRTAAVLQAAAGGALLLRAAAGRDGLRKWSGAEGARPADEVEDRSTTSPASTSASMTTPTTTSPVRASNEMGM